MTKPSANPKVFSNQDLKDLKHDDYLKWLTNDSFGLKGIIYTELKERIEKKEINIEEIKILNWIPEFPIIRGNYYIGSIDLLVIIEVPTYKDGNFDFNIKYKLLFEFKPNINSFSEVMRQIKVYESYIDNESYLMRVIPICITESNFKDFKDIFKSQNISIYYMQNIIKYVEETKKAQELKKVKEAEENGNKK